MKLLGIGYRARQGKTTLAEAIKAQAPERIRLYAFADELKKYCAENHEQLVKDYPDIPLTQKDDPIYGYTAMLQHIGTNVMRAKDENVWVNKLAERLEADKPEIAIISDVRFPNEVEFVQKNSGVLIKVVRVKEGQEYRDPSRPADHPSECALDDFNEWDAMLFAEDGRVDSIEQAGEIIGKSILESGEVLPGQ